MGRNIGAPLQNFVNEIAQLAIERKRTYCGAAFFSSLFGEDLSCEQTTTRYISIMNPSCPKLAFPNICLTAC